MFDLPTNRRSLLKGGATLLAAAAAMSSEELLGYAKAWAQTAPWKPEGNAQLSMLRWKYFVQSEDDAFVALIDAFTKAKRLAIDFEDDDDNSIEFQTPRAGEALAALKFCEENRK